MPTDTIKSMKLIENYIYIYQLNKFCVIPVYPESISDGMGVNFTPTESLGRSAPIYSYSNSGPRSIGFDFKLHRDLMEDVNVGVSNLKAGIGNDLRNKDYIDILVNYLRAMALPKYAQYNPGIKAVEPPQVAVRIGNDIFIKGVINSNVSVTYNKPILDDNKYGVVGINFNVVETDPYDAQTVAQKGGFRGITSTFKNGIYKGENDSYVYTLKEYTGDFGNSASTVNSNNYNMSFDDYKPKSNGRPNTLSWVQDGYIWSDEVFGEYWITYPDGRSERLTPQQVSDYENYMRYLRSSSAADPYHESNISRNLRTK